MDDSYRLRPLTPIDSEWVERFIRDHWGDAMVVAHRQIHYPATLPGFVALGGEQPIGLLTYRVEGEACEIVTLDSLQAGRGIGSALIEAVRDMARARGCQTLWLITTNDNLHAARFYQKRGFRLVAIHPDAVTDARTLKPSIPLVGYDGIPLRDEWKFEMPL